MDEEEQEVGQKRRKRGWIRKRRGQLDRQRVE